VVRVDEPHLAGLLVAGDPGPAVVDDLLVGEVAAGFQLQMGGDGFAVELVMSFLRSGR